MRRGRDTTRRLAMLSTLTFFVLHGAADVRAEERADFETCIAAAMGRFERALRRNPGPDAPDIRLLSQRDVLVCGGAGIQSCDLQDDRIACQAALTAEHDALTASILSALPEPDALSAPETQWSAGLYPQMWEIARGSSAGPDCSGQRPLLEAWCDAVEANRRLASAVMTWQLARLLHAVPSAVEAGWAAPAPPPMPTPRPGQ